jgi:LacI family transcriptional regulator
VRVTLQDVALEAGVSPASVDRVLHGRGGVRAETAQRVNEALARLNYRPNRLAARLARNEAIRLCFVLPQGTNTFMGYIEEYAVEFGARLASDKIELEIRHADVFDPAALACQLDQLPRDFHGVAVVALDHVRVREAINRLTDDGVHVVTLVSDVPGSRRDHHVGIDNVAAGRTAASLIGRFVHADSGHVVVVAGSLALRDHVERRYGFEQVLRTEYPHLTPLPTVEGRDDHREVERLVRNFLAADDQIVALYNIGAGNRGMIAALEASGRAREIVCVCHDLTRHTRPALIDGTVDAIVNQDAGHEVRSAARVLTALCEGADVVPGQERIRIDVFFRDNLPDL